MIFRRAWGGSYGGVELLLHGFGDSLGQGFDLDLGLGLGGHHGDIHGLGCRLVEGEGEGRLVFLGLGSDGRTVGRISCVLLARVVV